MRHKLLLSRNQDQFGNRKSSSFSCDLVLSLPVSKGTGFQGSQPLRDIATAFPLQENLLPIRGREQMAEVWALPGARRVSEKHRHRSSPSIIPPEVSSWCNIKIKLRPSGYIPPGGRARGVSFTRTKRAL